MHEKGEVLFDLYKKKSYNNAVVRRVAMRAKIYFQKKINIIRSVSYEHNRTIRQ